MRVAAAAALLSHGQRRPLRFVLSGGFNVGVRYAVDDGGSVLDPPCFTFEALAGARQGYPSEAAAMKDRLCQHYAVREGTEAIFVLEEASSTTLENAAMCKMLLARLTSPHLPQPATSDEQLLKGTDRPKIGLLTNAYHMPRALAAFSMLEDDGQCCVVPIYAEDYAATLPAGRCRDNRDWITEITSYYRRRSSSAAPLLDQLHDVLQARRDGVLTRSVAELLCAPVVVASPPAVSGGGVGGGGSNVN